MIFNVILVTHIVLSLVLIALVLLQQGKGADLGAALGGSSQSLFGAGGASTVLVRATTIVSILFMITSVSLVKLYQKVSPSVVSSGDLVEDSAIGGAFAPTEPAVKAPVVDSSAEKAVVPPAPAAPVPGEAK